MIKRVKRAYSIPDRVKTSKKNWVIRYMPILSYYRDEDCFIIIEDVKGWD